MKGWIHWADMLRKNNDTMSRHRSTSQHFSFSICCWRFNLGIILGGKSSLNPSTWFEFTVCENRDRFSASVTCLATEKPSKGCVKGPGLILESKLELCLGLCRSQGQGFKKEGISRVRG